MRTIFVLVGLMGVVLLAGGCATLGVGGERFNTPQQRAFEGASFAMFFEYENLSDELTKAQKAEAVVAVGNEYIQEMYPEFGSYLALLETMAADVSDGKFTPNVEFVYFLVKRYLDGQEEDATSSAEFERLYDAAVEYSLRS